MDRGHGGAERTLQIHQRALDVAVGLDGVLRAGGDVREGGGAEVRSGALERVGATLGCRVIPGG